MATTGIPKARLVAELKKLRDDPSDGVRCWPRDTHPNSDGASFTFDQDGGFLLDVSMTGPAGTPYEGGVFQLACRLPPNYPVAPPHVKFLTRVYHPNMDSDGRICIPVLKEGNEPDRWNPVKCNIRSALAQIRQLLAEPNPHDPLDADAARLLMENGAEFQRKAKEYTKMYAT
ncbi:ubiquitin-conjugating enzyme/RWD-like protein, partial [Catenaria anguillulae PL171]